MRIKKKRAAKLRSVIAKELVTSGKYKQRIVIDKKGRKHDIKGMTFRDLVEAIQEVEDYGD